MIVESNDQRCPKNIFHLNISKKENAWEECSYDLFYFSHMHVLSDVTAFLFSLFQLLDKVTVQFETLLADDSLKTEVTIEKTLIQTFSKILPNVDVKYREEGTETSTTPGFF